MEQNSTNELLIKKAYNEISLIDELAVDNLIASDKSAETELNTILDMKQLLDKAIVAPNPTSVKLILEDSMRSSALEMH